MTTETTSTVADSNAITTKHKQIEQKLPEKAPYNYDGKWLIDDINCFSKESEGLQIKYSKNKDNQYEIEMTLLDDFGVEYWFKGTFFKDDNDKLLSGNVECSTGDSEVKNPKVIIGSIDDNKIEVKVIDKNGEWLSCAPDNRILFNRKY